MNDCPYDKITIKQMMSIDAFADFNVIKRDYWMSERKLSGNSFLLSAGLSKFGYDDRMYFRHPVKRIFKVDWSALGIST